MKKKPTSVDLSSHIYKRHMENYPWDDIFTGKDLVSEYARSYEQIRDKAARIARIVGQYRKEPNIAEEIATAIEALFDTSEARKA